MYIDQSEVPDLYEREYSYYWLKNIDFSLNSRQHKLFPDFVVCQKTFTIKEKTNVIKSLLAKSTCEQALENVLRTSKQALLKETL